MFDDCKKNNNTDMVLKVFGRNIKDNYKCGKAKQHKGRKVSILHSNWKNFNTGKLR